MRDRKLGRDPKRIKPFLKLLEKLWLQYPDLRFFQLVRFIEFQTHMTPNQIFNIEDEQAIKAIEGMIK